MYPAAMTMGEETGNCRITQPSGQLQNGTYRLPAAIALC